MDNIDENSLLIKRAKEEINALVEKISEDIKTENVLLKKKIVFLEEENKKLKKLLREKDLNIVKYFNPPTSTESLID